MVTSCRLRVNVAVFAGCVKVDSGVFRQGGGAKENARAGCEEAKLQPGSKETVVLVFLIV